LNLKVVDMERAFEMSIPEERAVAESPRSFEEFFEAERVRLHRALFTLTGSRTEAEDIGQDAFVRLWERWERVGLMDDPAGYLHRTAMNVFRDRRRRLILAAKRAVHLAPTPDGYEAVEARSLASALMRSLSPRQREVLVLTEGLGYSSDEAGSILGIKGSTVRALHHQARAALKRSTEPIDG
jgi:RNA polymerase sigma-70 factor, ECF subfamily